MTNDEGEWENAVQRDGFDGVEWMDGVTLVGVRSMCRLKR